MDTITQHLTIPDRGSIELSVMEYGQGQPYLLLHGGAGTQSVTSFAQLLSEQLQVRVLVPVHPGFDGTARPDWLTSIRGLADLYAHLLTELELTQVRVIGNSIGGWIAAELALRDSERLSSLVLVDAVGIMVEDRPVVDVFSLTPQQLSQLSFHDPVAFRIDPNTFSEAQAQRMAANRAALALYGGQPPMSNPTLRERLQGITRPTLVVWGESDRVVDPEYGHIYAAAIPQAQFILLAGSGHLPQLETPDLLLEEIRKFASGT